MSDLRHTVARVRSSKINTGQRPSVVVPFIFLKSPDVHAPAMCRIEYFIVTIYKPKRSTNSRPICIHKWLPFLLFYFCDQVTVCMSNWHFPISYGQPPLRKTERAFSRLNAFRNDVIIMICDVDFDAIGFYWTN